MTDLKSMIAKLNLLPANTAAVKAMSALGYSPTPGKLAILDLALAKASAEELPEDSDLMLDLADLDRTLTPELAQKLTEEASEDAEWLQTQSAEDLVHAIMSEVPLSLMNPRTLNP